MHGNEALAKSSDRDLLLQLNEEYIAAYLKADVGWYRDHLADDFICIESDGTVLDKPAFLTDCAKGPDVAKYELAETTIRIYGDTGIIQARANFIRPDGSTGTSRYTDIWVRTSTDQWKTVSAQITRSTR
jgi:ketosteroid isomerase-like protein